MLFLPGLPSYHDFKTSPYKHAQLTLKNRVLFLFPQSKTPKFYLHSVVLNIQLITSGKEVQIMPTKTIWFLLQKKEIKNKIPNRHKHTHTHSIQISLTETKRLYRGLWNYKNIYLNSLEIKLSFASSYQTNITLSLQRRSLLTSLPPPSWFCLLPR